MRRILVLLVMVALLGGCGRTSKEDRPPTETTRSTGEATTTTMDQASRIRRYADLVTVAIPAIGERKDCGSPAECALLAAYGWMDLVNGIADLDAQASRPAELDRPLARIDAANGRMRPMIGRLSECIKDEIPVEKETASLCVLEAVSLQRVLDAEAEELAEWAPYT